MNKNWYFYGGNDNDDRPRSPPVESTSNQYVEDMQILVQQIRENYHNLISVQDPLTKEYVIGTYRKKDARKLNCPNPSLIKILFSKYNKS